MICCHQVVELDALRFLFAFPESTWHQVATAYSRALPLCASVQRVLTNDIDNVTNLLLNLELQTERTETLEDVLVRPSSLPVISTHP